MVRGALVGALLAVVLPAVASGQAIVPERVTTGPGDTGQLYTTVEAASEDGARVVFGSDDDMTLDDRSPGWDLFDRVGQTTRLLSPSTGDDDQKDLMPFFGASRDATRVVFAGFGRWTADDRDGHTKDVFVAAGGRVERVSFGPTGGNAESFDAEPGGLSADGLRVLFTSHERLTADDADMSSDVFVREGDTTTKVSPGNTDNRDAAVAGHSADARRVVVRTLEALTPDDLDDAFDLYLRDGATTLKLSPGDGAHDAHLAALSADGHVALVRTAEQLLPADTDARADLYRVLVGGGVELVSAGPDDVAFEPIEMGGFGLYMTPDGARVAFTSYQRHTTDDTDEQIDTFLWSAGHIVKVGRGNGEFGPVGTNLYNTLQGGADDASRLVVMSPERMTADDLDDRSDLFEVDMATGAIARVTTGPNGGNDDVDIFCPFDRHRHPCGGLSFASVDGSRIVFETRERLVPADTDEAMDVYQRAGGVTTLLSPARPGRSADHEVHWAAGAKDGSVAYLETDEQLSADDANARTDGFRVHPPAPGVVPAEPPATGPAPVGDDVPPPPPSAPAGASAGAGAPPPAGGATGTAALTTVPGAPAGLGGALAAPAGPSLRLQARPARLRMRPGRPRLARAGDGLRLVASRAVALTLRIDRAQRGRRAGGRCRAPSAALRGRPACTRYVRAASVALRARAGRQVLVVGSRLPGGRRLSPGRHRLTLTPRGGTPVRIVLSLSRR